jgi:ribonuclease P protein subunit RPR2
MKSSKPHLREIALVRITILFREADAIFGQDPKLATTYVKIARRIAMKVNLRIPKPLKRKYCKHCYTYLKPGKNCRVRIRNKMVVYTCFNCKKYMRFLIRKS